MREAAVEAARKQEDEPLKVAMEEEPIQSPDRHVGGEIPPVRDGLDDSAQKSASASEIAFDNPEAANNDVKRAVAVLVVNSFDGDSKKAFDHYDRDQDAGLSQTELTHMLRDAGLGKDADQVATAVIGADELAQDYDSTVTWDNFQRAFAE
jgi:hypothetical protein